MHTTSLPPDSLAFALLLAARAVAAVFSGKSLSEALAAHAGELPPTRSSAQDLAYGALRRYGFGDAILSALLARPLAAPEIRALLLCALYRLETRPDAAHTVVDQTVEAAGQIAHGNFRGLVNGVLRNYLRQQAVLIPGLAGDEAIYRHPAWWVDRLRHAYPDRWVQIVEAGNGQPSMTLRVNQRRGSRDAYLQKLVDAGISASPVGQSGILLAQPQPVDALPGFFDGLVSVQDCGAQRAAELLDVSDGQRVLDACAAPGGKAAHLLELADLKLTALEVDARRSRRIDENLARLGLAAKIKITDCRQVKRWWDGIPFDRILADVPCSASGVVRRHPDSKWLRRENDIGGFIRVQRQILEALWPTLVPGGKLLYATCSVFPEENNRQVAAFVAARPEAALLFEEQLLPQEDHDGFYYALLQKTG
ncbi:MAG: rRNA (cytosine967-C5)-methyltransferase [Pseudomonadota bacterium]|nr:rRNA (cytosine967-C5)-methyltransferase [Pseudomonadota bacterium]